MAGTSEEAVNMESIAGLIERLEHYKLEEDRLQAEADELAEEEARDRKKKEKKSKKEEKKRKSIQAGQEEPEVEVERRPSYQHERRSSWIANERGDVVTNDRRASRQNSKQPPTKPGDEKRNSDIGAVRQILSDGSGLSESRRHSVLNERRSSWIATEDGHVVEHRPQSRRGSGLPMDFGRDNSGKGALKSPSHIDHRRRSSGRRRQSYQIGERRVSASPSTAPEPTASAWTGRASLVYGTNARFHVLGHRDSHLSKQRTKSPIESPKRDEPKGLRIFQHKGVAVRPSCVHDVIADKYSRINPLPFEEHEGEIDSAVGADVGHAILSFEFIDRINDDMLRHYLPYIDDTLGKELGLQHDTNRLATPDLIDIEDGMSDTTERHELQDDAMSARTYASPLRYAEDYSPHGGAASEISEATHLAKNSPARRRSDRGDQFSFQGSKNQTPDIDPAGSSASQYGPETTSDVFSDERISRPLTESPDRQLTPGAEPPHLEEVALVNSQRSQNGTGASEKVFTPQSARKESSLGSQLGVSLLPGNGTAATQVWPIACSMLPNAASISRSSKLRAVDSMPDNGNGLHPLFDFTGGSTHGNIYELERPATADYELLLKNLLNDPAAAAASTMAAYAPGAARIKKLGQHKGGTSRWATNPRRPPVVGRKVARNDATHQQSPTSIPAKEPAVAAPSSARDTQVRRSAKPMSTNGELTGTTDSRQRFAPVSLTHGSSGTTMRAVPASSAAATTCSLVGSEEPTGGEQQQPQPAQQVMHTSGSGLPKRMAEEMPTWTRNIGTVAAPSSTVGVMHDSQLDNERRARHVNQCCPFSHEPMDSASAVDLRCGHRFALARLGLARKSAQSCYTSGFAQKDALICPLCGDQDDVSKPGAGKVLTTYSTNTEAYLGELRKDWQLPLTLPLQDGDVAVHLGEGNARVATPSGHPVGRKHTSSFRVDKSLGAGNGAGGLFNRLVATGAG